MRHTSGGSRDWLDGRQAERVLTVDRGNSTLDCELVGADAPARRQRVDPQGDGFVHFLATEHVDFAVGVSVVDGGLDRVAGVLHGRGIELRTAGRELRCPLTIDYVDPSRLGVDRWVAAVAARARFGDALIVDCGTAVTVDAVRSSGSFVSGAIAPGLRTMAAGLQLRAPALPSPRIGVVSELPTHDSEAAVRAGVQMGFAGLVEALAERLLSTLGIVGPVLITGGDADVAARYTLRIRYLQVPDLIHQGLRWLMHDATSRS